MKGDASLRRRYLKSSCLLEGVVVALTRDYVDLKQA